MDNSDIISQLNEVFKEIQAKYKDITPIITQIAGLINIKIAQNLDQKGRWDGIGTDIFSGGNQHWRQLSSSYKTRLLNRSNKSGSYDTEPTLRRTGMMKSTIEVRPNGKSGIIVTANSPYAAIHQFGGIINSPGRTPYITEGTGKAIFISNKKRIELIEKGHAVKETKPHTIRIPARPYITLTPEDLEEIIFILINT